MTSKRSFCKSPYDGLILSLHNIIINTLMSNWDYNDSFWMMQLFYIFEIYIFCHQLSKTLVRFFSFMYQNPLWLCSWQILWKIYCKISSILKELMTLQLDFQCLLLICFTWNDKSELERHFQIKKYYVRASSSKDHENTRKWFFMVLLCFFAVYICTLRIYEWTRDVCTARKRIVCLGLDF